jgi:uncharacterized protein (DUF697 family)
MTKATNLELIGRMLNESARAGFRRAYQQVRVDPVKYLDRARRKYGLPIRKWSDVHALDGSVIAPASEHIVASSSRAAALEGAGFGFSGILGTVPDMGILAAITVRMLQKLSLVHGFEYSTSEEMAGLWIAAASAAGLDYGREFLEKQAAEKLVPKVVDQVACKMGAEFAEKWVGRLVPVLSAGIAGTLNYYFVRSWGRRARQHFVEKRRAAPRVAGYRQPLMMPSGNPA